MDPRARNAAFATWARGILPLTLRATLSSFFITSAVAFVLLTAHNIIQGKGTVTVPGLGIQFSLPTTEGFDYRLLLLLAALAAWAMLSSFANYVRARQVRRHLRTLDPQAGGGPADDGDTEDDDGGGSGSAVIERMLLDNYMGLVHVVARTAALWLVVLYLAPGWSKVGVVVAQLVVVVVAVRRFARGQYFNDEFAEITAEARRAGRGTAGPDVVAAIYRRDLHNTRLTVSQSTLLVGVILVLAVLPLWLQHGEDVSLTALLLVLLWMQGSLAFATGAATLGFQSALWYRQRFGANGAGGKGRASTAPHVALLTEPTTEWPRTNAVWVRRVGAPTVVLILGPGDRPAPWYLARLSGAVFERGWSSFTLRLPGGETRSVAGLGSVPEEVAQAVDAIVDPGPRVVVAVGLEPQWLSAVASGRVINVDTLEDLEAALREPGPRQLAATWLATAGSHQVADEGA